MTPPSVIYLDHNATTPTRLEVVGAMADCYARGYGNPASQHRPGREARRVLEDARERIAEILGANLAPPRRDRLVFTGSGTEANNLAVLGIVAAAGSRPGRLIVSAGEHPSVLEPAEHLMEQGCRLDVLDLTADGVVRAEQLEAWITPDTRLVSVQLGNHETGVVQPIAELAEICHRAGVPLHTDAVQVVGKRPVNFAGLGAAALSVAAHKFQGPPGIGALLVRRDVAIAPLLFGGHQQSGLRPGTEAVALAVGMATALDCWHHEREECGRRLARLRDRFEHELRERLPDIVIHGARADRLPQTSNVAFPGLDGEMLRMALDLAGIACSVGAACSSGSTELSPTLRAMDPTGRLAGSSLRFSVGATTTEAEIDEAVRRIAGVCGEMRSVASRPPDR